MNVQRRNVLLLLILIFCVFGFSGCALLQIPGIVIEGTFSLLGELVKLISKLPKPPPGVF